MKWFFRQLEAFRFLENKTYYQEEYAYQVKWIQYGNYFKIFYNNNLGFVEIRYWGVYKDQPWQYQTVSLIFIFHSIHSVYFFKAVDLKHVEQRLYVVSFIFPFFVWNKHTRIIL